MYVYVHKYAYIVIRVYVHIYIHVNICIYVCKFNAKCARGSCLILPGDLSLSFASHPRDLSPQK